MMGRLDEALRRSGMAAAGGAETFSSPWLFIEPGAEHSEDAPTEVEREAAPVVSRSNGAIPRAGGLSTAWLDRLVVSPDADALLVEQFRRLAAVLHQTQVEDQVRVLMVTSADPGDGKTLTSINLALTLSTSYERRVLLIDADLRRPSLHSILQIPNESGLGDTLKAPHKQKLPVFQASERLIVAPAGRPDADPMSGLTSPRMQEMLHEAASRFDWVILDAPPMGPIADSGLLAPLVDAALLVIRAGRTHYTSVQKAIDSIGRDRLRGVVFNAAEYGEGAGYQQYYTAYGQQPIQR